RVLIRVLVMGFVFPHAKESVVHKWSVFRRYGLSPAADLFIYLGSTGLKLYSLECCSATPLES
ncbi:MAG: hypothetical protein P8O92_09490, partial [Luminiphilus sp.]|nr:hypothetical protein [Luminiphilus sp.]